MSMESIGRVGFVTYQRALQFQKTHLPQSPCSCYGSAASPSSRPLHVGGLNLIIDVEGCLEIRRKSNQSTASLSRCTSSAFHVSSALRLFQPHLLVATDIRAKSESFQSFKLLKSYRRSSNLTSPIEVYLYLPSSKPCSGSDGKIHITQSRISYSQRLSFL